VRTALSHSDPAQALIDASLGARLVVLGSPPAGEVSILGSKRLRVTVHAHCPVLLVGPEAAFVLPHQLSRVVVGADHTRTGHSALRLAAGFAVWHRIPLCVVEIEPQRDPGAEAVPGTVDPTGRLRQDFPGLVLSSERRSGEASVVLPGYSDERSLVVIGCRHSDDHWSTRIGPVATSVIHRGRGPVLVVGSAAAIPAPYSSIQVAR
jgi:hypothetical protein